MSMVLCHDKGWFEIVDCYTLADFVGAHAHD